MKHATIRALFDYWNERRGWRIAPERNDIDPDAIRRVLADTFILAYNEPEGHPFRIAGTRVAALFGCELKNEAFLELWTAQSRPLVRDLLGVVAHESIGVVAGVSAAGIDDGPGIDFELLALPLIHRGRTDTRLLGALVPTQAPGWLGAPMLGRLALGTLRYLGPQTHADDIPYIPPTLSAGRLRRGLTVYDGGQA